MAHTSRASTSPRGDAAGRGPVGCPPRPAGPSSINGVAAEASAEPSGQGTGGTIGGATGAEGPSKGGPQNGLWAIRPVGIEAASRLARAQTDMAWYTGTRMQQNGGYCPDTIGII